MVLEFLHNHHVVREVAEEVEARMERVSDSRDRFPESEIDYVLENPQLVADLMKEVEADFTPA
jgi:hypothetical protein